MRISGTLRASIALVDVLAVAGVSVVGCQRKVEVQSGTRTVCTAGEVISEDIKTVKVPADKAGAYKVVTITVTCDRHSGLATTYAEAQAALAVGDIKLAATKLDQVLAVDPTYRKAKAQSDAIKKGQKPAPDTNTPSTPETGTVTEPPPGDGGGTGSLSKWAPDTITGFTADKIKSDALSMSREYLPSGSSAAKGLAVSAEQFRTSEDAQSALKRQVKEKYSRNAASIKVKNRDAYFGTDGQAHAVIGFTDGAVLVALELTSTKSPESLRSLAEQVAAQLP
ncbi:MAG: hypothetical protein WCI74_13075 [Actinomycetes bacterium]